MAVVLQATDTNTRRNYVQHKESIASVECVHCAYWNTMIGNEDPGIYLSPVCKLLEYCSVVTLVQAYQNLHWPL